jgi:glycerol kinase
MRGRVLVVDVGTSSVRAAVVRDDRTFAADVSRELLPDSPADGLVEFDATLMATTCLELAHAALDEAGPVDAVGISNQRGSTVVWDRTTGAPIGPGLGWQDLRTVGACLALRGDGIKVGPNQSATKLQWLLEQFPERDRAARDLCFGTVDTWVAWTLSNGSLHVTDATNAAVTGLVSHDEHSVWDARTLDVLGVPPEMLPAIVDSSAVLGEASALPGAPPIASLLGDQQASLVGQGCMRRGDAEATPR